MSNPANRFERLSLERDADWDPDQDPAPATRFYQDHSQSIISHNDSPDIPFDVSLNPYRGCEHGCAYCYARPTHEYLGFSAGLDFESRIMVKQNAAELLLKALSAPGWKPQWLAMSGVTDPYQPVERKLQVTRRCLEVLAKVRHPVGLITKNHLVTRDIDLLAELARFNAVAVNLSISTLDTELAAALEPRASQPRMRLDAVRRLAQAGIPVGVLTAPIIPGLTDHELPALLKAAAEAGARWAGKVVLRLPYAVAPMFESWLEQHRPLQKEKVLSRIRDIRGGKLNNADFGSRMRGEGLFAEQIGQMFRVARERAGLEAHPPELSTDHFRRPGGAQLELDLQAPQNPSDCRPESGPSPPR